MKLFCVIEKHSTSVLLMVFLFVGTGSYFSQENNYERLKQNRENPSTWNQEMYQNDSAFQQQQTQPQFVYHTPEYELIRPFCGVGSVAFSGGEDNEIRWKDKHVLYLGFYTKTCSMESDFPLFFQLIVVMDEIDTTNYTHFSSEIISRNHPDVLGKGTLQLNGKAIELEAIHLDSGNDIALVNNRVFHLELGTMILLRANKSGELFTKQVKDETIRSSIDLNQFSAIVQNITIFSSKIQQESKSVFQRGITIFAPNFHTCHKILNQ